MANLGTARLRYDSIALSRVRSTGPQRQDETHSKSLPTKTLALSCIAFLPPKASQEEAHCFPVEASRARIEPSPCEITESLAQVVDEKREEYRDTNEQQKSTKKQRRLTNYVGSVGTQVLTTIASLDLDSPVSSTTTSLSTPVSHKEKRKSKRQSLIHPLNNKLVRVSSQATAPPQLTKNSPRLVPHVPPPLPSTMTKPRPISILVASLGNPPPYHSTRHSAAHIVLNHLPSRLSLPPFIGKSKAWGGASVSLGSNGSPPRPDLTLWQSPSTMNVSGPPLLKAWRHFLTQSAVRDGQDCTTALIMLHDEMETAPGAIKVRRTGTSSVKGHNGLKSVQASLQGAGLLEGLGDRFIKIGIGIGRPPNGSRTSSDVSAFVLGQLTAKEKEGLEAAAGEVERAIWSEILRLGGGGVVEF